MAPETLIPRLFISAIPIVGGLWVFLMGLGVMGKPSEPDADYERWYRTRGRAGLFFGPILIFFGLTLGAWAIFDIKGIGPQVRPPAALPAEDDT